MSPTLLRRSAVLPFLVLAYPLLYLFFRGGPYCRPVCFAPDLGGVGRLIGLLVVVAVGATLVAVALRLDRSDPERRIGRLLFRPPRGAIAMLAVVLVGYVLFLALDSLTPYGSWTVLVMPASFALFLPVWALYAATFPLAILLSAAGVEPTGSLRLAVRGVVLFVGFPLSAVLQVVVASTLADVVGDART